jgi:hypothetical protein
MEQDHLISNGTYDLLKKVVTIVLPAFATLYAALSQAWGFPNSEAVVATCAAVATFGGVLLSVSTKSWNKSEAKYDGEITITGVDEITGHPDLALNITTDPNELFSKRTVRFRPINELQ